ncbi:unnamed protein product [Echinostoma caproni]|uniref:NAC domain-containing protein n=1 Tax=Echinostoma caproni TaxID=27848 RepID=A0A183A1R1_9TREM|nr:unnamed protein product [Echinostoma caproni]
MDSQVLMEEFSESFERNTVHRLDGTEARSFVDTIPEAHSRIGDGDPISECSYPYPLQSELIDRLEFPAASQYDVYVCEQKLQSLPPAESFSASCYEPFVLTAVNPLLSSHVNPESISTETDYLNMTVPQVSSTTSGHIAYPVEVCDRIHFVSSGISEPCDEVVAHSARGYQPNPLTYTEPSQQLEYYPIQSYGQSEMQSVTDQYHASAYGTLGSDYAVDQSENQTGYCDTSCTQDFPENHPVDFVYQVTCTSENTHPVNFESISHTYQTTYTEFQNTIPVVTEQYNETNCFREAAVEHDRRNLSTCGPYTMVSQFSDQTIVPIESVVLFESNIPASSNEVLPPLIEHPVSEAWNGATKSTAYDLHCVNVQPENQGILTTRVSDMLAVVHASSYLYCLLSSFGMAF